MSSPFDPRNDDSGKTVVRPTPGARGPRGGYTPTQVAPGFRHLDGSEAAQVWNQSDNPLLACAGPVLAVLTPLRASAYHPDPAGLRNSLSELVSGFETRATAANLPREQVIAARYLLCTLLDEAAASTPWGSGGIWARDTLLLRFNNETWGGEKVFQLLSKLAEKPQVNRDLLELFYVCLALGLEGRYRVLDNGKAQLDTLRERLYEMVRSHTPASDRSLSLRKDLAGVSQKNWFDGVPAWVFAAVCAVLALSVYALYSTLLNRESDPVFSAVQQLKLATPPAPAAPLPAPAKPRLRTFLEPDIRAGTVALQEDANRSLITIQGDGMFEPGSAQLSAQVMPLIDRIAKALRENPGSVLVTGHTDAQPIRSARFPSNWHLSQERAAQVARLISSPAGIQKVQAEGRADGDPVAPNDTPANRAKNRRVELTLFTK